MRYLRLIGLAFLFSPSGGVPAFAGTDYKCVSDCTQQGYLYTYCQSRCSYSEPSFVPTPAPVFPQPHGTDYKCVSDCTQRGYQYTYCQQACGY